MDGRVFPLVILGDEQRAKGFQSREGEYVSFPAYSLTFCIFAAISASELFPSSLYHTGVSLLIRPFLDFFHFSFPPLGE